MKIDEDQKIVPVPHKGSIRRPSVEDAEIQKVLRCHAVAQRGGDEAAEWAEHHHDSLNAHDRRIAEGSLEALCERDASRRGVIARHEEMRGMATLSRRFVTSQKVATRYGADRVHAWVGILTIMILTGVEAFLVSRYVVNSGVLGLLPTRWWHVAFAVGYAVLPLAGALTWRSRVVNLSGHAQEKACDRLHGQEKRLRLIWVAVFALVVGPYMLPLEGGGDPFSDRPEWAIAASGAAAGLQGILQSLAAFTIIGLLVVSLLAASAVIAGILVNDRQADIAARVTHVREGEEFAHDSAELDRLHRERYAAVTVISSLEGFLEELAADRSRFVKAFVAAVEELRLRGAIAAQQAILDPSADGKVVPLTGQR